MPRRSAGEGQIRQRANGTWEARYIAADGRRPSVYGKTKREVTDRLRDALGDAASGIRPVDRQLTTGRYLTDWLEHHVNVRRSTFESYEVMVRLYLVPSIGRISLAKLQPEHVTAMRAPIAFTIWIAAVPTPDAPACTSAQRPLVSPPCTTIASHAVRDTSGIAAASASATFDGTGE